MFRPPVKGCDLSRSYSKSLVVTATTSQHLTSRLERSTHTYSEMQLTQRQQRPPLPLMLPGYFLYLRMSPPPLQNILIELLDTLVTCNSLILHIESTECHEQGFSSMLGRQTPSSLEKLAWIYF